MSEVTPTHQIDCRDLECPLVIAQTREELGKMKHGEILEVLGTDPETEAEIKTLAKSEGHHFLGLEEDGDRKYTRYFIRVR